MTAPVLEGDAVAAVRHRGSHLQIIAAAGSGKTEVVSQRVADLLADSVPANGIVAFTFTERAAEELKNRISLRVEERLGRQALDMLNGMFVGTIHAYCFRLLQQHVPRYETYDVLDDNQLTAFVAREGSRLGIKQLHPQNKLFAAIASFIEACDVVENELLDPSSLPEPLRTVLLDYLDTLERYRLLTYGQQIVRAVHELGRGEVLDAVQADLRHLIVDEYQDVNPAQERLIELLTGPSVELCVVGDDDQAIYQWRGSDISNIVDFKKRYENVATFEITTNRRSRPQIVDVANRFAQTIPNRLPKTMETFRGALGDEPSVVLWDEGDEVKEAGWIAQMIWDLNEAGVPFRDIAVLVRGRASYPRLIEAFGTFGIPVQPGGRTGLFDQPEAIAFGRAICWLTGLDWRSGFGWGEPIGDDDLFDEFARVFELDRAGRTRITHALKDWRDIAPSEKRTANLVGEFYDLLAELNVRSWDLKDPLQLNRIGTLARFSSLLADYESVRRRARPDAAVEGEQVGGQDRGTWYYRNLGLHILNYAQGSYEGFDGEPDFAIDAVDLTTVHRAKGLEWPVVFVPAMTAKRFPSSKTGQTRPWLVPRDRFAAARYEGSDADERRLFYVAMTRARDWLSISRHVTPNVRPVAASPYFVELADLRVEPGDVRPAGVESVHDSADDPITITYSELALFLDCGLAYRLRNLVGFQPRLATELGYGKAVHHVLRTVADRTKESGQVPTEAEIDRILDTNFFLPSANKAAHRELKRAARRLVTEYASVHADDLFRIWETERPFDLHLDGVIVAGRADVILDKENGVPDALAILDYKTSTSDFTEHELQLQVYADAGRREGLDVRAAYVHDLKVGQRHAVDVEATSIERAEGGVAEAAVRLRARDYVPSPGTRCRRCEVRTICGSAIP